ncbi:MULTISPECIES: cytochrome b [unclassified Beijerinckia]|uniref:cytochrome b n=1 Tax=unclassified Beijerinckia TaxID=2638183 RepID=UPI000895FCC4|nr:MULTISPECIES: cytochrome b [unclassified Beijerinckia]MDH7794389.1 cytochrome b561 [Beijerinckia sp. GAS462]SEB60744.1 cytochrome b561 [Beijerinckia sp. 28-YEA-48]
MQWRNTTGQWGALPKGQHWLGAALILAMLYLGYDMTHWIAGSAARFDAYQLHKSIGFCLLALTLLRGLWLLCDPGPVLPESIPAWERRASLIGHGTLYALVFAMLLSGWLMVSAAPLPVPSRVFGLVTVPNLVRPNAALFTWSKTAHELLSQLLMTAIILHVIAALKHHFIDGNDILKRILPFGGPGGAG